MYTGFYYIYVIIEGHFQTLAANYLNIGQKFFKQKISRKISAQPYIT